jgi:hypothetical protein
MAVWLVGSGGTAHASTCANLKAELATLEATLANEQKALANCQAHLGSCSPGATNGIVQAINLAQNEIAADLMEMKTACESPPPPPVCKQAKPPVTLAHWLSQNANVANAILWQTEPADASNPYVLPTPANKVAWANWTLEQKKDLDESFSESYAWLKCGMAGSPWDSSGTTDQPKNMHPNVAQDAEGLRQWADAGYMWRLYVANLGMALATEIGGVYKWSIVGYSSAQLQSLLDSSTMAWRRPAQPAFTMGTEHISALRAGNLPQTAFAAPRETIGFLNGHQLVGSTRLSTIGAVLQWMRLNMSHFLGYSTFGNAQAIWQYRGFPPLTKIVLGTTDANNPGLGKSHWTAGCHGSVGFLNEVLRAANIPVQPVWVCGHELAFFMTENLYLDHGDDPYNANVKNSGKPILHYLIDEATYKTRFTQDLTVNILFDQDPGCASVAMSAK